MVTIEEVNTMLWQRLKALADANTLPIAGKVYNGDRDLKEVSEDVTVKAVLVNGIEHPQRTDVNINVFTADLKKGANNYVANDARLKDLSVAIGDFIRSIDYVFQNAVEVIDFTETKLEEPSLRQHYKNFLIRMNIYD